MNDVAVIGVGDDCRATLGEVTVLDDVTAQRFDETTHTWELQTGGGLYRARIVVSGSAPDTTLRPYLGVAVHGLPNWFIVSDPEQARYVLDCLTAMERDGATRIEVRYSTQRVFDERPSGGGFGRPYWRRMRRKIPSAFDLSSYAGVEDEVYDGPAGLHVPNGRDLAVRVRLTGHVDPIDGRYHWQGTVLDAQEALSGPIALTVGTRRADARITERTAQGTYSVAGVGTPPFALDDVDVVAPR